MGRVETNAEAAKLNRTGETAPYAAANGHLMIAALRFPRDETGSEREYRVGDEIRYESWSAWCAPSCNHAEVGPLPDW
jgi:hypothetical protein